MSDLDQIFKALPSSAKIADHIGEITDRAVRAWKLEGRRGIPPKHWPSIIRLARKQGADWITWEALEAAHEKEVA